MKNDEYLDAAIRNPILRKVYEYREKLVGEEISIK